MNRRQSRGDPWYEVQSESTSSKVRGGYAGCWQAYSQSWYRFLRSPGDVGHRPGELRGPRNGLHGGSEGGEADQTKGQWVEVTRENIDNRWNIIYLQREAYWEQVGATYLHVSWNY